MPNTYTRIYIHLVFGVLGREALILPEGFGGFSVSHSQRGRVIAYIQNQEEHHKKRSFAFEYRSLLRKYAIDYDERYLFEPVGDQPID